MNKFTIGMLTDGFRADLRTGIKRAAQLGAQCVQVYAVEGEMAPENLDAAARRDLLHYTQDLGLYFSAICGDLGGHAFQIAEQNPARIDRSRRIMDLALDLDCKVVTTHIGVVPAEADHPRRAIMAEACNTLGAYADSVGAYFALETGPETSTVLRGFLDGLDSRGMRVNFDPANLVMVVGEDPVQAVKNLAPYIVHTHAKDGVMVSRCDPVEVYNFFAEGGIEDLRLSDYFVETPFGKGQVNWPAYLVALEEIGYTGALTIEREVGDDPDGEMTQAIAFLREQIAAMK